MAEPRYQRGMRSRVVGFLKIALPLVAIALLSTVFLVQKEDVIEGGITFSPADRDMMQEGLTVVNPQFSGVTVEGDQYFLTASRAVPDSTAVQQVSLSDIDARTIYSTGRTIELVAKGGTVFVPQKQMDLHGNVTITTSDGYVGTAPATTADLASGSLFADGPVVLDGPIGRLEAGSMRVETAAPAGSEGGDKQVFTFENGVKLTFLPK